MWPELHVPLPADHHLIVATHGALVALGVLAGLLVAARRSARRGSVVVVAAAIAVASLVGSHALFVWLRGGPFGLWSGGLTSAGCVVVGLGLTWLLARVAGHEPAALFDVVVPAGLVALGIGRLGCFLGGCCAGQPSDVPWALVVPALGGPPRHPLPLYSAALDFVVAGATMRVGGAAGHGARAGRAARLGLVGFASGRFLLEFLRDPAATDPLPGGLTLAQMLCVLLLVAVLVAVFLGYRRSPSGGLRERRSEPTLESA
jgi:phosphatidylglycerol:prolipoprotein diacylglycerol transferase